MTGEEARWSLSVAEARLGYDMPVDACDGISRRAEEAASRRIGSFDADTAAVATLGAVSP